MHDFIAVDAMRLIAQEQALDSTATEGSVKP